MSRKNKKIFLQIDLIELESQDVKEEFDIHKKEFEKKFHQELKFINSTLADSKTPKKQVKKDERIDGGGNTPQSPLTHKIYRNLAKILHPDTSQIPNADEHFKRLGDYYEQDDIIGIISMVNEHKIPLPSMTDEEYEFIDKQVRTRHQEIESRKQTLAWAWAKAKPNEAQDLVYKMLNLNIDDYEDWKKGNQ